MAFELFRRAHGFPPWFSEHDPEKPAPHSMRGVQRFSEKTMLQQELERDDGRSSVITLAGL
jgi:hypothetical protein